jgi:hypothetical protein
MTEIPLHLPGALRLAAGETAEASLAMPLGYTLRRALAVVYAADLPPGKPRHPLDAPVDVFLVRLRVGAHARDVMARCPDELGTLFHLLPAMPRLHLGEVIGLTFRNDTPVAVEVVACLLGQGAPAERPS